MRLSARVMTTAIYIQGWSGVLPNLLIRHTPDAANDFPRLI